MFPKGTAVLACLGFFSLSAAYDITSVVEDGIPGSLNISTEPFVRIGHGYYYIESKVTKNWYEAYESCRRMNADLIAFETIEEWDLIRQYIVDLEVSNIYWTAGNDLGNEGEHVWHSTGEPLTLNIWSPGEPNNKEGVEHCDEVWYGGARALNLLNDKDCSFKLHFICEAPQPKIASFIIW
ncbi:GL26241 [Drosophila persimilis]|uniref:GL26241 n=1 Tax=Drosophila persimilis TaxID=7234 RepID=B4GJ97_DROPE|nr:GL26241 [Drosophila persimilis]